VRLYWYICPGLYQAPQQVTLPLASPFAAALCVRQNLNDITKFISILTKLAAPSPIDLRKPPAEIICSELKTLIASPRASLLCSS
jgi:hypothetical protein